MPTNVSIQNVPDEVAERLRERAKRNHRSLQGELLAILEAAVPVETGQPAQRAPIDDVIEWVRASGMQTTDDSTQYIRELRDSR